MSVASRVLQGFSFWHQDTIYVQVSRDQVYKNTRQTSLPDMSFSSLCNVILIFILAMALQLEYWRGLPSTDMLKTQVASLEKHPAVPACQQLFPDRQVQTHENLSAMNIFSSHPSTLLVTTSPAPSPSKVNSSYYASPKSNSNTKSACKWVFS